MCLQTLTALIGIPCNEQADALACSAACPHPTNLVFPMFQLLTITPTVRLPSSLPSGQVLPPINYKLLHYPFPLSQFHSNRTDSRKLLLPAFV